MEYKYLKNKSGSPIVFYLNTEDIQKIAAEYVGRKLTTLEIQELIVPLSETINWVEAIEHSIELTIKSHQTISH